MVLFVDLICLGFDFWFGNVVVVCACIVLAGSIVCCRCGLWLWFGVWFACLVCRFCFVCGWV